MAAPRWGWDWGWQWRGGTRHQPRVTPSISGAVGGLGGALSHGSHDAAGAANRWELGGGGVGGWCFLSAASGKRSPTGICARKQAGEGGSGEEPWLEATRSKTSGDFGGAGKTASVEAELLPTLPASLPVPRPRSLCLVRRCFGEEKLRLSCKRGMASRGQEIQHRGHPAPRSPRSCPRARLAVGEISLRALLSSCPLPSDHHRAPKPYLPS